MKKDTIILSEVRLRSLIENAVQIVTDEHRKEHLEQIQKVKQTTNANTREIKNIKKQLKQEQDEIQRTKLHSAQTFKDVKHQIHEHEMDIGKLKLSKLQNWEVDKDVYETMKQGNVFYNYTCIRKS